MNCNDVADAEEDARMSRWLVLPLVVLPSIAPAASGAAVRDRDHDRLPDRWEKRYHLSTFKKTAKGDPDHDGLRNLREYRLRTHPRRKDTDRDGLRDRAEIRRFHTNPRKKDTDGDGYSDREEIRAGTNPRDPGSHPSESSTPPTPPPTPSPNPTGFPDASNTGVPPGTTLTSESADPYRITQAGAVINAREFNGLVEVHAPNVTIRNSQFRGNDWWQLRNYSTGLTVEDSEFLGTVPCHNGIGNDNLTVRRSEFTACENGVNIDGGNVVLEDSWIHDLETDVAHPDSPFTTPHTDGIQIGQGAHDLTIRHNNISPQDTGGAASTSGIIMWTQAGSQNTRVRIEDNILDGSHASYALYAPRQQTADVYINRNRMSRGVGGYTACVRVGVTVTQFDANRDVGTGARISPDNGVGGGCSN